jgi:hypothetical protein
MSQPSTPSPLPHFTLAGLFEFVAGTGLLLGLFVELSCFGLFLAAIAAAILFAARSVIFAQDRRRAWRNVLWGCAVSLLPVLLGFWIAPFAPNAREAARRAQCAGNLRFLAMGLHSYRDANGHFPPQFVADANGKPMHSWRVLIQPHLDAQGLYAAYKFNEPWDGPNNSKLASQMPRYFRCPSDTEMPANMTNYFYVLGCADGKQGGVGVSFQDVKDKPTIMLIESSTARVNWMEPRDLTLEELLAGAAAGGAPAASSHHFHDDPIWRFSGALMVAMHDARVDPLPKDIDAETLRALLTINGGEQVNLPVNWMDERRRFRPEFVILVSITLAFVVLAILRRVRLARRMRQGSA